MRETDKETIIQTELPGLKKEDVNIELNKGILTVSGERKDEKKDETSNWHRRERTFGRFRLQLRVPENITEKDLKAHFHDGVLEITYPKSQQERKRIAIN